MTGKLQQKLKDKKGQAIVEMALTLPLLLLILCGILDFGWIFMNQYRIDYAAYNGARYASLTAYGKDSSVAKSEIEEKVREDLPDSELGTVTVTVNTTDREVTVDVSYPIKVLTFVAGTIYPSGYYTANATDVATY